MTTFINIITVLSILITTIIGVVIVWTNSAINRRKKGLKDFEIVPFFAKERTIEANIDIEPKQKQKKITNNKNKKRNNYIFSFNIQEDEPCENSGKMAIN